MPCSSHQVSHLAARIVRVQAVSGVIALLIVKVRVLVHGFCSFHSACLGICSCYSGKYVPKRSTSFISTKQAKQDEFLATLIMQAEASRAKASEDVQYILGGSGGFSK